MKGFSLREQRKILGWTQAKTARLAKVHRSILSQIETGDVSASDPRVDRIRRVLLRAIRQRSAKLETALAGADHKYENPEPAQSSR
jgi:predicted transcriptional regulator